MHIIASNRDPDWIKKKMEADPAFAAMMRGKPHPDLIKQIVELRKPTIKGEDK